jgi:hypothetical protein
MSNSRKRMFFAIGGVLGVLVLIGLAVLLVLGVHAKRQVQILVSNAVGMDVSVTGGLDYGFFPRFHVAMENVQIRNAGSEVASAAQANLGIELLPLLYGEVRIDSIELQHVRTTIERQRDGKLNFEMPSNPSGAIQFADTIKVSLADLTVLYTDRQSGKRFEADSCHLDVSDLRRSEQQRAPSLDRLSFTAGVACETIRTTDLVVSDVQLSIDGTEGVFDLSPVTMHVFGGLGSARIHADFSGAVPQYRVRYSLSKFRLAQSFRALSPRNIGDGPLDFATDLSMQGATKDELVRSAAGEASLRGHDLTLVIGDIDQELARYASSQSFNLVDLGALFFAGPLGLAVTKGFSFASVSQSSGGSSQIRTLVSEWRVERGVAQAKDVAMATRENRIALKGGLDFVNERFKEVTVAVIDAQGCATAQEKIRGPFDRPEVEKPSVATSLAGPARTLLRQAKKLFGDKCDVFYAGSVAPPR